MITESTSSLSSQEENDSEESAQKASFSVTGIEEEFLLESIESDGIHMNIFVSVNPFKFTLCALDENASLFEMDLPGIHSMGRRRMPRTNILVNCHLHSNPSIPTSWLY